MGLVKRWVKFKQHKRGIPNGKGGFKTCLHCRKKAVWTAVKVNTGFRMEVRFCADHYKHAKSLG